MSIYEICSVPNYQVNYGKARTIEKDIETICKALNTDCQFHERLHKTDMLKLCVDVDKLRKYKPDYQLEQVLDDIVKYVKCDMEDICYTANAGVDTGSHHIVIPKYCMLSANQKLYWEDFKNRYNYGKEIDNGIFDKDVWFRLPNQTAYKDKNLREEEMKTPHNIIKGKMEDFVLKYTKKCEEYKYEPVVAMMNKKEGVKPPVLASPQLVQPNINGLDMNDKYINLLFNVIGNDDVEWDDWFKVAGALKYNNYSFEVFDTFSQKSKKYNSGETAKLWDGIKNTSKYISIHTLQNIAKNNKLTFSAYKNWLVECGQVDLTTQLFTTGLIADYFVEIYSNMYLMNDDRLYYWNGVFWKRDDKRYSNLTNFVDTVFTKDLRDYANKKMGLTQDEDKRKKIAEFVINAGGIRKNGFRKGLIDDILTKITNNDVEFNTNPFLFAFNNVIYDLKTGRTIKANPDDYISMSAGYNYIEPSQMEKEELNKIINSIFPDTSVKNHYLEILATGLCGIQLEKCCVATGVGGNGKSMINSLMLLTCGDYGYKLPSSVLLREIKEGANPELANMDCVRFTLAQEPDRNKKINSATLKELTGDTTINVRGLYSSKCKIALKQTTILEANDLPKLDEVNPALSRRMDITPFITRAVSQEEYDAADDKMGLVVGNPYYKSYEFQHKYKCVLFEILQPYIQIFIANGYKLTVPPEQIKHANNKYLASSDTLFEWFLGEFEECEGEMVSIKDIFDVWNIYIIQTSSMSRRAKEKLGSKKKLEEEISKNMFLSKYLKGRKQYYNGFRLSGFAVCGWRRKTIEDEKQEDELGGAVDCDDEKE